MVLFKILIVTEGEPTVMLREDLNQQASVRVVNQFYSAFCKRNVNEMIACYDEGVIFSDPVFLSLRGQDAMDMWSMLCKNGKDLQVKYEIHSCSNSNVIVLWDAFYTFSKTNRPVHNHVTAKITVLDGKIVSHNDKFDMWRWSRQAFGLTGLLLGWTPIFRSFVRKVARNSLLTFQRSQ